MLTEERKQEILEWSKKDMIKFQLWLEEHEPSETMLWNRAWWDNNCFIRDRLIHKLFNDGSDNYEIVGAHMSKSILCPVVLITYKNVGIIVQYNFYDWQIMVNSDKPLTLKDLSFYACDGDYFYYQGIPNEYHFEKYSETNNVKFAVDNQSDDILDVYAFMVMLKEAIDNVA